MKILRSVLNAFKQAPQVRSAISHPHELKIGDIIQFTFLTQAMLSGKRFEVTNCATYNFSEEYSTSFELTGVESEKVWLSATAHEKSFVVSRQLSQHQVFKLFSEDAFAQIFEVGNGMQLSTRTISDYEDWTAAQYTKTEDCIQGHYDESAHPKALSKQKIPCDYYALTDETQQFLVEIEVYPEAKTEVYLSLVLDQSHIAETWLAKTQP